MFRTHEQQELAGALHQLCMDSGASNAFVFDAWGLIWAYATRPEGTVRERLFAQLKRILEGVEPRLHRGGKLDRLIDDPKSPMFCVSFSSAYVLGLWVGEGANDFQMRRAVKAALPRIEAMTLALPPPDGSDPSSGAMHGRA